MQNAALSRFVLDYSSYGRYIFMMKGKHYSLADYYFANSCATFARPPFFEEAVMAGPSGGFGRGVRCGSCGHDSSTSTCLEAVACACGVGIPLHRVVTFIIRQTRRLTMMAMTNLIIQAHHLV
jgi:hypothetical protein